MQEKKLFLLEQENAVRFYSLARYALLDAFLLLGLGVGKRILLPSYICRDLLAPIAAVGAEPRWYTLDEKCTPASSPDDWPDAEVVLAVNYFGFPQDMEPFRAYSARTGAVIIEDNAHGYLSKDPSGKYLGTRAPLGIFSLRKTLRIPDGAALLVSDPTLKAFLQAQVPINGKGVNSAQTLKTKMRRIPFIGSALLRGSTSLARTLREFRTGSRLPLSNPLSESVIPAAPNPWAGLLSAVKQADESIEVARRQDAYVHCAAAGKRFGVTPLFSFLPNSCSPYGYPFRGSLSGLVAMQGLANRMGFELVTWPDLPTAHEKQAPSYYRNVSLINFLW